MTSLLGITLFVLALMLAIFLHEGGHFATAKFFGMKVERFFLGFGPTIWSFRKGETEYGIKAFPLGGFCKIAGMSPYENDGNFLEEDRSADKPAATPTPPERQFRNKPAWQRAIVLAAGSFTHFIVAILLIWMVLVTIGVGTGQATTTIDRTVPLNAGTPSPAQTGGLEAGDEIVAVAGTPVESFEQLRAVLQDKGGQSITIEYVRDGQRRTATVTPVEQDGRGFLGFQPGEETRRTGVLAALPESIQLFWDTTVATVKGLGGFVTGLADRISAPEPVPAGAGGGGGEVGNGGGPIPLLGRRCFGQQPVGDLHRHPDPAQHRRRGVQPPAPAPDGRRLPRLRTVAGGDQARGRPAQGRAGGRPDRGPAGDADGGPGLARHHQPRPLPVPIRSPWWPSRSS
jgi:membrane-associated protease RseP (regulator of RpoE activity)